MKEKLQTIIEECRLKVKYINTNFLTKESVFILGVAQGKQELAEQLLKEEVNE
tara:strand:- start:91 stop:249 length:159 start_codon:yes stop_codon:yes gene_type:complete